MYMLMLLDIVITGGVNLRPNFSPGVLILIILFLCFVWVYVALYRRLVRFGKV